MGAEEVEWAEWGHSTRGSLAVIAAPLRFFFGISAFSSRLFLKAAFFHAYSCKDGSASWGERLGIMFFLRKGMFIHKYIWGNGKKCVKRGCSRLLAYLQKEVRNICAESAANPLRDQENRPR